MAEWCSGSSRVDSIVPVGLVVEERRCRWRHLGRVYSLLRGWRVRFICLCVRSRKLAGDLCRHKLSLDAKVAVYKCGRWIVRERKC